MEPILYADLIQLKGGHILTSCGNFSGETIRARQAYYIDDQNKLGPRLYINCTGYIKASYESDVAIPPLKKVLNLPGEQHFEVNRSDIRRMFRAKDANVGISPAECEEYNRLAAKFADNCGVLASQNGLTGSGAVHSLRNGSDFDWMIYGSHPSRIKNFVENEPSFIKDLPFTMEHAYRKYAHFKHLSTDDLDRLFLSRWKYFRFRDRPVSISFVDPSFMADTFLDMTVSDQRITAKAVVEDGTGSYYSPRIIPVRVGDKTVGLFTWLFLYNGAFSKGDSIEFSGLLGTDKNGNTFVVIESSEDYIKHES